MASTTTWRCTRRCSTSRTSSSLPVARLEALARRFGLRQHESAAFLLKHPHVFTIFDCSVQRVLYCRLCPAALRQSPTSGPSSSPSSPTPPFASASSSCSPTPSASASSTSALPASTSANPDNFELSVVLKNPAFSGWSSPPAPTPPARTKYVGLVYHVPMLARCSIEGLRELMPRTFGSCS